MADERGAKVEKWKLSEEHLSFQKRFKDLKKARQALEFLSAMEQERMLTLQEAWQQLQISYDGLAQEAPESPLKKPQGMQFAEEEAGVDRRAAPQQGMAPPGGMPQGMDPQQAMIRH